MTADGVGALILIAVYGSLSLWIWNMDHGRVFPVGRKLSLRVLGAIIGAWLGVFLVPRFLWSIDLWPWPIRYHADVMLAVTAAGMGLVVWTIREQTSKDEDEDRATAIRLEGWQDGGSE